MEHYDWNEGWLFTPTFDPALVRPECPELSLTPVRLPHTVKPLPYNYCNENDYQRLCGYRREFFAPKEWLGRTVLLTFGAVAHDATVFCNGRRMFHHGCGYTAFTVDLTGALRLGQKNVVAVRCDSREDLNIPPFGGQLDALTYGGIYRAVSLDIKEPAYLRDVFIEAKAEGDFRIYTATVGETVGCTLQAEIRSPAGSRAVYSGELSLPITGTLNNVHPWSLEHPTLYTLTVRLIRPGTGGLPDRVLDEKTVRFGFRTVQFVAGGLYLNGQRVELRGLDRHQSYPYQGYAMPDSVQRLDAQLLKKELGCNAVRTCYAPPSPAFLDACDELGLLVFPEMPGWQHIGDEVWQAQALQNCREMVCQYRSHPSIFLWGARISGSPDNEAFYKRTNEAIHRLDPTRPTAGARNHRKSQLLEDVYAYNDYSSGANLNFTMNALSELMGESDTLAIRSKSLSYTYLTISESSAARLKTLLIGVLPGMGPVATVAMLLPITYALDPASALIMLAGIYYGAQYGGSTTAILVNIPGDASAVVTCLDGHKMAKRGRAGAALGIAALGSFFAGCVATLLIAAFAPPLTAIAFQFGPAEYFSLMVLGLIGAVVLATGSLLKAVCMIITGLLLGLVGTDINSGAMRYTFGFDELQEDLDFVAISMGIYGFAEIGVGCVRSTVTDCLDPG